MKTIEDEKLLKDAYVLKSFYCMGESHLLCYSCDYCRARGKGEMSYWVCPSQINELFSAIPVAVNIFHGDPLLYANDTLRAVDELECCGHKGPVVVITKGSLGVKEREIFEGRNLKFHFGLSYFGNPTYDKMGTAYGVVKNAKEIATLNNATANIEYRPIIRDINDGDKQLHEIFSIAKDFGLPIAYSGLQVEKELEEHIKEKNLPFKPYDGFEFGMKKNLPNWMEEKMREFSEKHGVPIFKKTSCAITYCTGQERDYNAHYYRPNEMGCAYCPMFEKCHSVKKRHDDGNAEPVLSNLPFNLELVYKEHHECKLHREGLCKFPSEDCLNIKGALLKTDRVLTTTDVRLIKWLSGYTVDAVFYESPYMSKDWDTSGVFN